MTGHQADFIGALPGAQNLEDLDATCFFTRKQLAAKAERQPHTQQLRLQ